MDALLAVLNRRLKSEVVAREKLATRADAFLGPAIRYPGLLEVLAFAAPGVAVSRLEREIHSQLDRLRNEAVSEEELSRERAAAGGSPDDGRDDHFAISITDWESMTGQWREMFRHRERVRAVRAEDVQRLAREIFDPGRRTVAVAGK
jgi:zinc protease